jgi:hypothetical protein
MTFTLPADASLMKQAFKEKGGVWIMKPVRGLQVRLSDEPRAAVGSVGA